MKKIWATIFMLGLLSVTLFMSSSQQAASNEQIAIENNNIRISLQGSRKDSPLARTYFFELFDKHTQTLITFSVYGAHTHEIKELKIYRDSLIIWGKLSYTGGDSITRVNLQTYEVEDEFWTYHPVFSSDNRVVVYVGHYPRSVPKNTFTTDIVKVYDFDKTPLENRVNPERGLQPRYCGIPVFPEKNARKKNEEFFVYDPNVIRNSVSPPFLWLENSRKMLFITRDRSTGEYANFLIMIDLQDGIMNPRILRKRVDSSLSEGFRDGITEPIVIKEITETEDAIVISTYRSYGKSTQQSRKSSKRDGVYTIQIEKSFLQ